MSPSPLTSSAESSLQHHLALLCLLFCNQLLLFVCLTCFLNLYFLIHLLLLCSYLTLIHSVMSRGFFFLFQFFYPTRLLFSSFYLTYILFLCSPLTRYITRSFVFFKFCLLTHLLTVTFTNFLFIYY